MNTENLKLKNGKLTSALDQTNALFSLLSVLQEETFSGFPKNNSL